VLSSSDFLPLNLPLILPPLYPPKSISFFSRQKLQGLIDPLSKKVNHNLISTMINNKPLARRRRGRNPPEEDKEEDAAREEQRPPGTDRVEQRQPGTDRVEQGEPGTDRVEQRPATSIRRTKKRQLPEEEQPEVSRARGGQKRLAMIDREQNVLQRGPGQLPRAVSVQSKLPIRIIGSALPV